MEQKNLTRNIGLILALAAVSAFVASLFNKKSRTVSAKFLGFGTSIAADYLVTKYLPKYSPQLAKVVSNNFSLTGNKGGKVSKKRLFKKFVNPQNKSS